MDFQSRVYGFDGVFPRTIKDLTLRPGEVIEGYIRGIRVRYVGPAGYFFLIVAISVLLMELTNLDFYEFSRDVTPITSEQTDRQIAIGRMMTNFVYDNFRAFKFGIIPLNTFWIWLFVRKRGYNFIESSVPAFYAQGQLELFFIINLLLLYFFDWHLYQGVFIVEPCYYGFIFITWFSGNKFQLFLKGAMVWLASYLTYILVVALGAFIWLITHQEIMQSIKP